MWCKWTRVFFVFFSIAKKFVLVTYFLRWLHGDYSGVASTSHGRHGTCWEGYWRFLESIGAFRDSIGDFCDSIGVSLFNYFISPIFFCPSCGKFSFFSKRLAAWMESILRKTLNFSLEIHSSTNKA